MKRVSSIPEPSVIAFSYWNLFDKNVDPFEMCSFDRKDFWSCLENITFSAKELFPNSEDWVGSYDYFGFYYTRNFSYFLSPNQTIAQLIQLIGQPVNANDTG